ncbi:MAG: arsinothricin resistance N-acetyltransferase ArsN1 family B [Anaerolineales bacterium]
MIRVAKAEDAVKIAKIYNHYIVNTVITFEKEPVTADEISTRMADVFSSSLSWLVLENNDEVIGYAYATKWRARPAYKNSVETTIYLAKDSGGKGYGKSLYSSLISTLKSSGFHTAIGGIALPNEASVGLHESLGFKKVAHFHEVGYKFDTWIDVGFWQIML